MSDSQLKAKTTENAALLNTTEPSKRGKFTAALVALALTGTIVLATSPNGTAALRRRKKIVDEQYPELDSRPRRRPVAQPLRPNKTGRESASPS